MESAEVAVAQCKGDVERCPAARSHVKPATYIQFRHPLCVGDFARRCLPTGICPMIVRFKLFFSSFGSLRGLPRGVASPSTFFRAHAPTHTSKHTRPSTCGTVSFQQTTPSQSAARWSNFNLAPTGTPILVDVLRLAVQVLPRVFCGGLARLGHRCQLRLPRPVVKAALPVPRCRSPRARCGGRASWPLSLRSRRTAQLHMPPTAARTRLPRCRLPCAHAAVGMRIVASCSARSTHSCICCTAVHTTNAMAS